jgi:hypothetical protein
MGNDRGIRMGRLLIGVEDRKAIIVLYSSSGGMHFMELDVGLVRWHCLLALHDTEWTFLIELPSCAQGR